MTRLQLINLHKNATPELQDMIFEALTNDPLTRDADEVYLQPALEERLTPKKYKEGARFRLGEENYATICQIGPGKALLIGDSWNRVDSEPFNIPITLAELNEYVKTNVRYPSWLPVTLK